MMLNPQPWRSLTSRMCTSSTFPGPALRTATGGQDVRRAFKSLGAGMDFGQSGGTWKLTPHTAIGSSTSGRLLIQPQAAS